MQAFTDEATPVSSGLVGLPDEPHLRRSKTPGLLSENRSSLPIPRIASPRKDNLPPQKCCLKKKLRTTRFRKSTASPPKRRAGDRMGPPPTGQDKRHLMHR